jgi:hypothetical protein
VHAKIAVQLVRTAVRQTWTGSHTIFVIADSAAFLLSYRIARPSCSTDNVRVFDRQGPACAERFARGAIAGRVRPARREPCDYEQMAPEILHVPGKRALWMTTRAAYFTRIWFLLCRSHCSSKMCRIVCTLHEQINVVVVCYRIATTSNITSSPPSRTPACATTRRSSSTRSRRTSRRPSWT